MTPSASPGETQVRPAVRADGAAIAALARQLGYDPGEHGVRRALEERDPARCAVLVAERAGVLLGWLDVGEVDALHAGRQAIIHGLVVDDSARGAGIGSLLLAAAESWARARGHAALRVRSNVVRTAAHRFYVARGYRQVKTQHLFETSLAPIVKSTPAAGPAPAAE